MDEYVCLPLAIVFKKLTLGASIQNNTQKALFKVMNITKILMIMLCTCAPIQYAHSLTPNQKLVVAYATTEVLAKVINKIGHALNKNAKQPEKECSAITHQDIGDIAFKSMIKSMAIYLTIKNHTLSDVTLLHILMQYCPLIHEWLRKETTTQTALECFVNAILPPIIFLYLPNTRRN